MFSYTFRLLFIVTSKNKKNPENSRQFILKNCFKVFWEFLNLNLAFAVFILS